MHRDRETLERQTHRTLLTAILNHAIDRLGMSLRARALGVRLDGRGWSAHAAAARRPAAASLESQARLRDYRAGGGRGGPAAEPR